MGSEGLCKNDGTSRLNCSVECDGGGFDLKISESGALMHFDRIRMASCGQDLNDIDKSQEVTGGIDDRDFRLDLAPVAMCSDMGARSKGASQELPSFSSYPAPPYRGPTANIVLSKETGPYRTRVIEASHFAPNFAGRFVVTTWGCGTSCRMGAIIDVSTGRSWMLPFTVCCATPTSEHFKAIDFRAESRLIAFSGMRNEEAPIGVHYYEFDGLHFNFIKSITGDGGFAKQTN